MATTYSWLDRMYAALSERTGRVMTRDPRLELIAADRALEASYQVGTEGTTGITHPLNQLRARIFPLDPAFPPNASVGEIATWHYYPTSWVDPIDAAVDATLPDGTKVGWWHSPPHKAVLLNESYTAWGLGLHFIDVPNGARRYYFIGVFAGDVEPLPLRRFRVEAGTYTGRAFTAQGTVIGGKTTTIGPNGSGASADMRWNVPKRGPHLHVVTGTWRTLWVPESANLYLEKP